MTRIRSGALAGLVLIASLLAACGSSDSGSSGGKGSATDRAFVSQMVPHHKSAIEMAKIAQQRGQSRFVKTLADSIVGTQKSEIASMQGADQKLASAGVKVGDLGVSMSAMGMDMNTSMLKTASPFDRAFIDMMVPHHQGAVRMARIELAKGQDAKLKSVAQGIIAGQSKEIGEMNAHRKMAFGAPSPAGGVPAEGKMAMQH